MTNAVDTIAQNLPISEDQKQQISDKAGQVTEQVQGSLTSQIGTRASQMAQQTSTVADALRASSDKLQEEGQEGPARVVNMAAERADQLGTYLSSSDPNQILADVEDFCRQQPWVVIAGGIALGFLGARFLKSSSSRRYESYQGRSGYGGYTSPGYHPNGYTNSYPSESGYEPATSGSLGGYASDTGYAPETGYASGTDYPSGTRGSRSHYETDDLAETSTTGGI